MKKPFSSSFIIALFLYVFLALFSFISAGNNGQLLFVKLIWSLVIAYIGLCIYRSGVISKYRSALFVLIAFFFFLEFKFFRFISCADITPPYCHIAQAPTLLNFIHSQFLAVTSGEWRLWGALTLGFLWLLIMFTTGQGICSWVCFYGGLDEACSKILRKPVIKLTIPKKWRDFPIAFLIFLLILSFLQGLPVFCNWFCPLKLTTAFWDHDPVIRVAQIAFFSLFLGGFIIILPALSKKRTFCSLICPFGALVSMCGKASPYKIIINKETCICCGKCLEVCPVFSVEIEKSGDYKTTSYCNKCGRCIDVCPVDAIDVLFSSKSECIPLFKRARWSMEIKDIFIFLSLLITGVISGSFVPWVMLQLLGIK